MPTFCNTGYNYSIKKRSSIIATTLRSNFMGALQLFHSHLSLVLCQSIEHQCCYTAGYDICRSAVRLKRQTAFHIRAHDCRIFFRAGRFRFCLRDDFIPLINGDQDRTVAHNLCDGNSFFGAVFRCSAARSCACY